MHKKLSSLSIKLITILKDNKSLELYRQEMKESEVLDLIDSVQQISVSIYIYAVELSSLMENFIDNAEGFTELLLLKDSIELTADRIAQEKNSFNNASKSLTIAMAKHIREDLL